MRWMLAVMLTGAGLVSLAWSPCRAQVTTDVTTDPAQARIVYDDAQHFARALRLMADGGDTAAILQAEYLDRASPGLRVFAADHELTAETLLRAMRQRTGAYDALKDLPERLMADEATLREALRELQRTIPGAIFLPTYFLIGDGRNINEASEQGILLSVESPQSMEHTALTALHEVVHVQQAMAQGLDTYQSLYGDGPNRTLLALAIREGSADFIAHLASGGRMFEAEHRARRLTYLVEHERALWERFRSEMRDREPGDWMWTNPDDPRQPANLGYAMGFRIVEAYYEQTPDKAQAVREILAVTDYSAFLARSRYGEQFGGG